MIIRSFLSAATLALALSATAFAAPSAPDDPLPFLSTLFSSNMVLQRQQHDPVWGWSVPGDRVTVTIAGQTVQSIAGPDGKWMVRLKPIAVGGPYTMHISGAHSMVLDNILVGDVWLCSGQSNMEFGIGNMLNAQTEIANSTHPLVRLFMTPNNLATTSQTALKPPYEHRQWVVSGPDTVVKGGWNGFSAVGYTFGTKLQHDLNVPIGLLQSTWGGTPAETWVGEKALASMADFQTQLKELHTHDADGLWAWTQHKPPTFPTIVYNGMITPLMPFGIKGVIWYQGESNAGRAQQYVPLMQTLIQSWRTDWGEGDFPFLLVQLAGWQPSDAFAPLREAQWQIAQRTKNSGIATAIDVGDANDIHPTNKRDVGERLAAVAEAKVYGRHVPYAGPTFSGFHVTNGTVHVTFAHTEGGLVAAGGTPVGGFELAGDDGKWFNADARIVGNAVDVHSASVPSPVNVRYAWHGYQVVVLRNGKGFPAFPFTSIPWPESAK